MGTGDTQPSGSRDARAESVIFAKAASLRKLSAAAAPVLGKQPSGLLRRNQSPSLRRLDAGAGSASAAASLSGGLQSPSRRPSTAASIHSRIHQALRRSESEFVFSSKEATVDGFLYSSRFQQATATTVALRPGSSSQRKRSKQKTKQHQSQRESLTNPNPNPPLNVHTNSTSSPPRAASLSRQRASVTAASDDQPGKKPRPHTSSHLRVRVSHGPEQNSPLSVKTKPNETSATLQSAAATPSAAALAAAAHARQEEAVYVQRKRRCARTFEEMILARIQQTTTDSVDNSNVVGGTTTIVVDQKKESTATSHSASAMERLLADGIIQSIVTLSALPDQATQVHCCRALYYLSQVRTARKPMVLQGVVTAIKALVRSAASPEAHQDLAATLCHLCEEPGLVETMLFEGLDRCLVRLFTITATITTTTTSTSRSTANHAETKRICALAVFNISCDAGKIKHFVESFSQLLISSTKSSYGHSTASGYLMKAVYNVARLPMFHASLLGENIPRFLASQLPHVADEIQILALQALISLCDVPTNRLQILSQAFCKLLEKMLTIASNPQVQERALLVLLLLSIDDGSRIKLCNWVPAATIVSTAADRLHRETKTCTETSPLVYLDSCILRNLCDSVLTHHELLEEAAVPLLLKLSRHADHAIKSNAVCALVSIIASSPEESAEYVVEILDELITLARSPVHQSCLFAVSAIYNIACNDDCLALLMQSMELLDCLLELASCPRHESVAELTAAIIYRLATTELDDDDGENNTSSTGITSASTATTTTTSTSKTTKPSPVRLLMERGFFPVLVHLIRQFRVARPFAVNTLYLLAQSDGDESGEGSKTNNRHPLFPHGSDEIWQLVSALSAESTPTTTAATAPASTALSSSCSSTELDASRSAVTLLAYLAQQRVNHPLLVRNGAVFRFLKGLRRVLGNSNHDETIVLNSAYIFYALTVSQEGCEQLIRDQGIEECIHIARTTKLLDSVQMHLVKELVMMAICRVSSFMGLEVKLIEHGAIDAVLVLALVSSTDSSVIKALCIKTLANCLVAKTCARPLIEHGVIWALSSLAVAVDSPETRYACAVSLCNLATVPFMLARFLDAGAPRALLHLLQKSGGSHSSSTSSSRCSDGYESDARTALVVVKAIANLVANEKICMAFVNDDIERHLSAFFSDPQSSPAMRQLAAMVLLRVTSANDAVVSVDHLKHGVFVWMEQIIVMEDDVLVKNCMLTVHDLTCSTTIDVAELDVDHILRILQQVVQRHAHSGDVLTLCLWILYNLSCQLSVLSKLVRPEILTFIRRHVPAVTLPFPPPPPSSSSCFPPRLASTPSTVALINGALAQSELSGAQSLDVKLCGLILHNLSCARESSGPKTKTTHCDPTVLASLVNAQCGAMLSDIYLQRDDLKETCAVAVCNLAIGRVNSTRIVQDRAGELLVHFVFSSQFHRCHYHLVSVAIRKMVNAPGNQQLLLHCGIAHAIVHVLELTVNGGALDVETTRNLMASLCVLSKCKSYLPQLLQDGVLGIVIAVSESRATTASTTAQNNEILGYCFEILSELCSVNFESFAPNSHPRASDTEPATTTDVNVINTLTKLSELHHVVSHASSTSSPAPYYYYARGGNDNDDNNHISTTTPLAFAQLLTFMKKSPVSTNAVKKNLELQATFQVPARKWLPDAQPTPRDPPPLVCTEIPMTEGSQSIPRELHGRIKGLGPLAKEPLVRNASSGALCAANGAADHEQLRDLTETSERATGHNDESDPPSMVIGVASMKPMMLLGSRHASTAKKLQRGLAGRNLSLSGSSTLLM